MFTGVLVGVSVGVSIDGQLEAVVLSVRQGEEIRELSAAFISWLSIVDSRRPDRCLPRVDSLVGER